MSKVTISLSDAINATMESRANAAGFRSKKDNLLTLVQADCNRAELEPVLEARLDGPFEPLENDWKQRVRDAAQVCSESSIAD
jgi:hypothetical protein